MTEVTKRHIRRAKHLKLILFSWFYPRCNFCHSVNELEIDLITALGDAHHRYNSHRRYLFYVRQFVMGNVQILCKKCNSRKGLNERYGSVNFLAIWNGQDGEGEMVSVASENRDSNCPF